MNKDIESAHKDAYHNQRQKHWTMENQNVNKILKKYFILNYFQTYILFLHILLTFFLPFLIT